MIYRYAVLAAVLGVSGLTQAADFPTNEVISTAGDTLFLGIPYVISDTPGELLFQSTTQPGQTAAVLGDGVAVSARTNYGHNRAFVRVDQADSGVASRVARSVWYEQVTINGGTGTATATFNVRLRGVVDAGREVGTVEYKLMTSATHPRAYENVIGSGDPNAGWWPNATASTPIVEYRLAASPYNDTSRVAALYGPSSPPLGDPPEGGFSVIPSVQDGGLNMPPNDDEMQFQFDPTDPDLILSPGAGQVIDLMLTGTFSFTYGEAFYLIGEFGASIASGLDEFQIFGDCEAGSDGLCFDTGPAASGPDIDIPTMLDFGNGAFLSGIFLPQGATASFASGTPYNVAAVPEPGEWALLLAGLGLVGWRTRRRA